MVFAGIRGKNNDMVKCLPVIAGLLLSVCSFAIVPDREYVRLPQNEGLLYKRLEVVTPDGYSIETWFYPAQDMPEEGAGRDEMLPYRTLDDSRRPTLIICNGDAGNMSYQQIGMAGLYTACGLNVVTFDWRGFGDSSEFEMDPDFLCYTEMLDDYGAVIAEVLRQAEVDESEIYVMGWSTGAYLSMITAYGNDAVKGCILSGTPSSFEDVIPQLVKVHPAGKTEANLLVPEDFPSDRMPVFIAPEFTKPILLIVGSEDDRTPLWMSEKIFAALPDSACKRMSVFDGAGHGGMQFPFIADTPRWMTETLEFMAGE